MSQNMEIGSVLRRNVIMAHSVSISSVEYFDEKIREIIRGIFSERKYYGWYVTKMIY